MGSRFLVMAVIFAQSVRVRVLQLAHQVKSCSIFISA